MNYMLVSIRFKTLFNNLAYLVHIELSLNDQKCGQRFIYKNTHITMITNDDELPS